MTVERDVQAQRDEILAEVAGRSLVDVFMATCDANGERPALVVKDGEEFVTRSWADYRDESLRLAMGLRVLGVDHGDCVALMMTNRPEHVIADIAALVAGATPVSIYNTFTADQVAFVAGDCDANVAVVEDATFLDRWLAIADRLGALKHVIVVDDGGLDTTDPRVVGYRDLVARGEQALADAADELEASWRRITPDDPATVIYTSGTTGPPKGVILSHRNVLYQLGVIQRLLDIRPGQRGISYLPLAHVAERMVTHYVGVRYGGTIYFVKDMSQVVPTLQEARPQMFMAVPRVWEKMHAALLARIDEDPRKARIARKAIEVGTEVVTEQLEGRKPSAVKRAQHKLFDRLVFAKIRDGLGLDELRYAISGAAPISPSLLVFFRAIGIEILEVYGMTESTAVITANEPGKGRVGTVGTALPGVEVTIADDGEILTRGPNVTPGYWRNDEATGAAIDDDGWLHTGDLGSMDDDGYVTIRGRKKELIITAGGKNLSPNNIEEAIKRQSPIIGQICAIGDTRPFVTALIVLDTEMLPSWREDTDVDDLPLDELAQHPTILDEVQSAVERGNAELSRVEQVREWVIVASEWTAESDELTPSLKLKRDVVHTKYRDLIDRLYTQQSS